MRCLFLLFFFFPSAAAAQSPYQHLLHKTYAERYLAIDTVYFNRKIPQTDSTQLFAELAEMAAFAKANQDRELLLETEFLKAEYYMVGKQKNKLLFLPVMLGLKDKADKQKILQLQIRTRQKLGYFYFHVAQQYGPGFLHYLESYELLKSAPESVLPDKQEMVSDIGTAYYYFGELAPARRYYTEALSLAPSYKKRLPINMTNTMGLLAVNEKKYDSANYYYTKAYSRAEMVHDSTWMGIVAGNKGWIFFQKKQYDKAIPLLEFNVRESLKANEMDQAADALITLAEIWLIKKDYPKSISLTAQAKSLVAQAAERFFLLKDIYRLQATQQKHLGNLNLAYQFSDSSRVMADSIYNRRRTVLQQRAENKVELQKYQNELLQTKHEAEQRNNKIWATIITLFLISAIVIIWINRQRVILKLRQRQLQTEKKIIETELDEARHQLESFTNSIREKNQLIEHYSSEVNRQLFQAGLADQETQQRTLDQLLHATLLTDDQWREFTLLFEKVHAGFLQRLKQKMPNLSPADVRYVVLNKLNLAPKEMAAMLGVRPDAIRLYRHRLRKKLGLSEAEQLEAVLNEI